MKVSNDYRNQYTTLDAKQAKNRIARKCLVCCTGIDSRKRYCAPCYATRLEANIAKNRPKYRRGAA